VIYVDTSVALAHLFGEDRHPPPGLWGELLVSSRLLEYELWTRVHARHLGSEHLDAARLLLERLAFLELSPIVLSRAVEPFPIAVRTPDALHLASLSFLRAQGQDVLLASYDQRQCEAAVRLGFQLWDA
jgi:hypothetical protein